LAEQLNTTPAPIVSEGVTMGTLLLVIVACIIAALGLALTSQATTGVGVMCGSVLLAIFARIAQAAAHHKAVMRQLGRR
jgi:hypothetical protein